MANKKLWLGILAMMLIFGMTVAGCGNDAPDEGLQSGKSIDSRLVGGKWWNGAAGTENSYYRFTASEFITATNGVSTEIAIGAYTENGTIKATAGDTVLARYVFVDPSEYNDRIQAAITAGNEVLQYSLGRRKLAAQSRNMVRFTVSGITLELARWENL